MDIQTTLPIFPPKGTRVVVPDPETGGRLRTWTMGEARDDGGKLVIRCVGVGDVPVGMVVKV